MKRHTALAALACTAVLGGFAGSANAEAPPATEPPWAFADCTGPAGTCTTVNPYTGHVLRLSGFFTPR